MWSFLDPRSTRKSFRPAIMKAVPMLLFLPRGARRDPWGGMSEDTWDPLSRKSFIGLTHPFIESLLVIGRCSWSDWCVFRKGHKMCFSRFFSPGTFSLLLSSGLQWEGLRCKEQVQETWMQWRELACTHGRTYINRLPLATFHFKRLPAASEIDIEP